MVQFNELSVSPDAKTMTIDVTIPSESYYDNVYLDSIIIDNQDTYVGTGPSSHPVYEYVVPPTRELVYKEGTTENKVKHLRLVINAYEMNCTLDGIFFVYVMTKGTYKADTPCGCDDITTMASVTNMKPFYDNIMQYIKEVGNDCAQPKGFIDQFLRTKSLEVAIRTRNYPQAIKLWKEYRGKTPRVVKGGCGCHGAT